MWGVYLFEMISRSFLLWEHTLSSFYLFLIVFFLVMLPTEIFFLHVSSYGPRLCVPGWFEVGWHVIDYESVYCWQRQFYAFSCASVSARRYLPVFRLGFSPISMVVPLWFSHWRSQCELVLYAHEGFFLDSRYDEMWLETIRGRRSQRWSSDVLSTWNRLIRVCSQFIYPIA